MKYASVCSGVEAPSQAWEPLGWEAQWFSEIEDFPSSVLKHHFPNVPNLGDMTKLINNEVFNERRINLLIGGTPCQSFSVAGLRKGLEDPRGNLALEFVRILSIKKPKWFIWENVPGVLSSNGGRDFASIIGAFTKIGYGVSWRVLDAQFFGVPQRRRRVFVVGYLGDWRPSWRVLFECESLSGDIKARREERKGLARNVENGTYFSKQAIGEYKQGGGASSTLAARDSRGPDDLITSAMSFTSSSFAGYSSGVGAIRASGGDLGGGSESLIVGPQVVRYSKSHRGSGKVDVRIIEDGTTNTLTTGQGGANQSTQNLVIDKAITINSKQQSMNIEFGLSSTIGANDYKEPQCVLNTLNNNRVCPTLTSSGSGLERPTGQKGGENFYMLDNKKNQIGVRRLTPMECERLQGFKDNWTNIPGATKSKRYKACGNSMAVPVIRWLGERIQKIESGL